MPCPVLLTLPKNAEIVFVEMVIRPCDIFNDRLPEKQVH